MNRGLAAALVLLIIAPVSGCAWLVGEWAGGAKLAPKDRMTFSHKKHVVDEEVECSDCHGDMSESVSLQSKRQLPKESACMECHDRDDDCASCHSNPKAPLRWLDHRMNGIRFSHKKHLARDKPASTTRTKPGENPTKASAPEKVDCATCHSHIQDATRIGDSKRPKMFEVCGQCHQKDFSRDGCLRCHTSLAENGRKPLSMFSHTADWLHRHGSAAKGATQVCAHCHKETSCTQCHARNNARFARPSLLHPTSVDRQTHHRGDWLSRHALTARLNPVACLTCHQQSSCQDCHKAMKVEAKKLGEPSRHPAGWMVRGSAQFHGREARRNALACAACHDRGAASNCVTCHRVGGSGGNPHPPGWRSNLNKRTSTGCVACHL